jgi:hypothetical protein
MEKLEWIVINSKGEEYTNLDGPWEEGPKWDCQVVIFRDKDLKWAMRHGAQEPTSDYFYIAPDGTCVGIKGIDALLDYVVNVLGVIKVGRMQTKDGWQATWKYAFERMNALKVAGA